MSRLFFSLLLAAFALDFASAQQALTPVVTSLRSQPLVLPAETALVSLTPADAASPRQTYTIRRTFAADRSFTVEWKTPRTEVWQRFRADGTLLASRQTSTSPAWLLEQTSDAARTTIRTVVTEKGAVKSDKKAALSPGIALREELQHLNVQAWAAGIRDGLKFQSLSPDGGMVGDFQILYKVVTDPIKLSDKYTYPAEFRAAVASGPFVVADMMLQGVGAFFYPHHFYLVYRETAEGLRFVAYFGENPQSPIFQYAAP